MRYDYLTFDCYGTLVDWRNGILSAFAAAVAPGSAPPEPERLLELHARHEADVQAGAYRSYRQVLTETARRMAVDLDLEGAFASFGFLADSLPRWRGFDEVNPVLSELADRGVGLGILSNIDDDLLAATLEQFEVEIDLLVTAQQVRSYKPAAAHFERARARLAGRRWLHVAQSRFHDILPAARLGIPAAWINRLGEAAGSDSPVVPSFGDLTALARWLG